MTPQPELPFMSDRDWGTSPFATHSPEWHEDTYRRAMARFESMPVLKGKDHPHLCFLEPMERGAAMNTKITDRIADIRARADKGGESTALFIVAAQNNIPKLCAALEIAVRTLALITENDCPKIAQAALTQIQEALK